MRTMCIKNNTHCCITIVFLSAVQFVWDCTFESLKRSKPEEGSGCILAHCMGLGKTLSVSIDCQKNIETHLNRLLIILIVYCTVLLKTAHNAY